MCVISVACGTKQNVKKLFPRFTQTLMVESEVDLYIVGLHKHVCLGSNLGGKPYSAKLTRRLIRSDSKFNTAGC